MWYVNRDPQWASIIPEPVIRIDDLVKGNAVDRLARIFAKLLKDGVSNNGQGRPESEEELFSQLREWTPEELADWIWRILKDEDTDIVWQYIPHDIGPVPSIN